MSIPTNVVLENPFPGLRPFQRGEEHLFFGRESQVDRMIDKLAASRFLSVVGTSGTGKSSLVNCGVLPALHRGVMANAGTSWCVVRMHPGGAPIRSLARAFASEKRFAANIEATGLTVPDGMALADMVQATLSMSSLGLSELFEFAHFEAGMNLLVYVDQFEELFRYQKAVDGSDVSLEVSGEAVAFVNLLLEAHSQTLYPIYVITTMRSDFLGDCSHFDRLPEVINEGQYLVPRLTREERRQAIARPIAVAGAELSPVLLTRLVNDVGENPDQLSVMQHAINRTWAYWQAEDRAENPLSLKDYDNDKVGTMARALDLHANEAYAELKTQRDQKICERVFKALTDKGTDPRGIRRPLRLERLCKIVGACDDEVIPILNVFRDSSRSFLMPPKSDKLEPTTVVDISHEILMRIWGRLRDWTNEEAKSAATYRRIAETAELHDNNEAGLWSDPAKPDLKNALDWKAKQEPNADWAALYRPGFKMAITFLERSKELGDFELAKLELERKWRKTRPFLMAFSLITFFWVAPRVSRMLAPALHSGLTNAETQVESSPAATGLRSVEKKSDSDEHNGLGDLREKGSSNAPIPTPTLQERSVVAKKSKVSNTLINAISYQLCAVISVLGYFAFDFAGRRIYRRYSFADILAEVSAQSASRESTLDISCVGNQNSGPTEIGMVYRPVELVPASFGRILLAGTVDAAVFIFLAFLAFVGDIELNPKVNWYDLFFFASLVFFAWILPALLIWSRLQGTLGDLALGIRLTDLAGRKPSFWRTVFRYVASQLSWLVFGLGFLVQLFPPQRQSLHDRIAGTILVRKQKLGSAQQVTSTAV